jgi:lysophospholipase L1-like esterase
MSQILVFGDSVSYGAWDRDGGWADRIKQEIHKKVISSSDFSWLLHNLSVDGDTSKGLLKRFESETKPRIVYGGDTIFIISIGDNDTLFDNKKKKHLVSPEQNKKNLQKIFQLAKKYSPKIIFVGSCNIDDSKVDPVPWEPGFSYRNKYTKQYNEIAKKFCKENKITFVELFGKFKKTDLADGLHPNTVGHKKIFNSVWSVLKKLL